VIDSCKYRVEARRSEMCCRDGRIDDVSNFYLRNTIGIAGKRIFLYSGGLLPSSL
jgi:hypothetical protein